MADSEPSAKRQCDGEPSAVNSDKVFEVWLDVNSLGVHCGHGPVRKEARQCDFPKESYLLGAVGIHADRGNSSSRLLAS